MSRRTVRELWLGLVVLGGLMTLPAFAHDTVYYYLTDTLHSSVIITDANRNVVEGPTYYAPYGQVLNRPMRDGPGYTDHEEDPATGLVYMQQRYYDPESGRFLSTDPVLPTADGGNFNRYWYANDNPYRYTDPDGQAAVVVKEPDGTIKIIIPVHMSGIGATPAMRMRSQSVAGQLKAPAGVIIRVVQTSKPIHGVLNNMTATFGGNTKVCGAAASCTNAVGGGQAYVDSNRSDIGGVVTHESMHFAGMTDKYTAWTNKKGQRVSKPNAGYGNNIMGTTSGRNINQAQVNQVENNKTTVHCTTDSKGQVTCL